MSTKVITQFLIALLALPALLPAQEARRRQAPPQGAQVNPVRRRPVQLRSPVERPARRVHRFGVSVSVLINNAPLREFSVFSNNTWYAQGYRAWLVGNAGLGFSVGGAYDLTFANRGMFRLQFFLETAGWIMGVIDIGGGIRIPLKHGVFVSAEGYFSIGQSGGTLARLADHSDTRRLYAAFFGFKFRTAFEFPINKRWYSSLYLSYAAYPWHVANHKSIYINGIGAGAILDSLQYGIEIGRRF